LATHWITTPPGAGTDAATGTVVVPVAPVKTTWHAADTGTAPTAVIVNDPVVDVAGLTVTLVPHAVLAAAKYPEELLLCEAVTETVCVSAWKAIAAGAAVAALDAPKLLVYAI
jgi:hypothetical protein